MPIPKIPHQNDSYDTDPTRNAFGLRISSGVGAPLFEQRGPQTRIYRAPVRAFGKIMLDGKTVYGVVLNVSSGGCLLKTEATFEVGQELTVQVTLVGGGTNTQATLAGEVRHKTMADGRITYGIEFSRESENRKSASAFYSAVMA